MSRRHLKALFWGFCPVALLALSLYLAVGADAPPWQLALVAFFLFVQIVLAVVVIAAIVSERRSGDSPNPASPVPARAAAHRDALYVIVAEGELGALAESGRRDACARRR